ncbi:MAG: DEAD/DEAH box helicase family protein [Clostridiales bacterium]|nr:DEAD/DEAH box helicase family protein [Clostridiales bacterium]
MFNGTLLPFQAIHETNLLKACAENEKLILQAPTGSGKTVLVTKFIDDYLDENPETVFIWMCPGAGSLQDQSRNVFENFTAGINTGSIYDFIAEYSPQGSVYFVNWDKITKSDNIVLRDGEDKNLLEKIIECKTKLLDFFLVIDEEHLNKKAADMYERIFAPKHVLRISATTKSNEGHKENVSDDEVIAAGLIASGISINENLTREAIYNDNLVDDLLLLQMADEKRKEIQAEYDKRGLNIRPLVLVQFPNGSDEWIARVKSELSNMGYTEKNGLVTSWFSGDHPDEPEELSKLNGKYAFLLFKQAIATGWDCPRAKILVKLREGTTETFDIQTVGRIRRMPERHHYESELLDHCYVYTLDQKFNEGLTSSITDSFYLSRYLRKDNAPSIMLDREYLSESDRQAVDEEAVVKAVRAKLLQECDLDQNGFLSKKELELTKGFTFGLKLKTRAVEGFARTTHDLTKLQATFCGEHEINIHDDGLIIRDAKRRIAQSIGIDENISSKALSILFDSSTMKIPFGPGGQISFYNDEDRKLDLEYKVIQDMGHREYSAFLVNNWELLAEILGEIDKTGIELTDTKTEKSIWSIPKFQDYKKHNKTNSSTILEKNVFTGYSNDILVQPNRSHSEIAFEQWCEVNDNVEWVYKNGDKGQDFFTIVYRVSFRRYNFYPDYIIRLKNGETWIIETKGGAAADGSSANIDKYAAQKFDALKEYCEQHPKVKWGFVRNIGVQLLMSNTEWVEEIKDNNVWKPISDFI